ncbi:MAG: hypothetical protein ACRC67_20290 [Inquilinus sp.]|uniref:hypothetical protein n=1 Tax=Inquilinus sp. TaxID=1932117 RepID=UPI003F3C3456
MKGKHSMIEVTRDAEGRPRVVPGTAAPILADFLETDLRGDAAWTARVAERLGEAGERGEPITGNLYALEIRGAQSVLRNIHDAKVPALMLPTKDLAAAVGAWLAALRKPGRAARPRRKG